MTEDRSILLVSIVLIYISLYLDMVDHIQLIKILCNLSKCFTQIIYQKKYLQVFFIYLVINLSIYLFSNNTRNNINRL